MIHHHILMVICATYIPVDLNWLSVRKDSWVSAWSIIVIIKINNYSCTRRWLWCPLLRLLLLSFIFLIGHHWRRHLILSLVHWLLIHRLPIELLIYLLLNHALIYRWHSSSSLLKVLLSKHSLSLLLLLLHLSNSILLCLILLIGHHILVKIVDRIRSIWCSLVILNLNFVQIFVYLWLKGLLYHRFTLRGGKFVC